MNPGLRTRFSLLAARSRQLRTSRALLWCWLAAAAAGLGLLLLQWGTGWSSLLVFPLLAGLAVSAACALVLRPPPAPTPRDLAPLVEQAYPELRGLALTAAALLETGGGAAHSYLPGKVLADAAAHAEATQGWEKVFARSRRRAAALAQWAALVGFGLVLWEGRLHARRMGGWPDLRPAEDVVVQPGNTELERGDALVVTAHFARILPPGVEIVTTSPAGGTARLPLVKSLADPIFGVSVPGVTADFRYRLEYAGQATATYQVKVYEHPRVERADFALTFPAYTGLPARRVEDTRRVSAVEGTQLALTLQLNKPVAGAALVAHDAAKTRIPLEVVPGQAVARLAAVPFAASQTYDVVLVDSDRRNNRPEAPFVLEVLKNQKPDLHLTSPRGDARPSPLEEIAFAGTVLDDFGVLAYGLGYTIGGAAPRYLALGQDVPGRKKTAFQTVLRLEELGVKPDDLISWFAWADDRGPDGQVRRTSTDLYFGEVRPFEEIFRESQSAASDDDDDPAGGAGGAARKLTELEKQIMSATWKLQASPGGPQFATSIGVVRDSQSQALAQAQSTAEESRSPRAQALWGTVTEKMGAAVTALGEAGGGRLAPALASEQAAYQALLALQAHETEVSRRRSRGGAGQGGNQRQIDQLDLAVAENRYETQRQARSPESAERREQNQVLSRLQELARRQQDVNDRLKEMQTALQDARTETEREEVRRQLKRLEEEQRQMLADMDEVRQRMQRPELQSSADQQSALDQTRQDLQKSAEASGQGSVAQALASGTRAQRQLQQLRDEVRKQNSSAFAQDLQEMRSAVRELQNAVDQLAEKMSQPAGPGRKSLAGGPDQAADQAQVAGQQQRLSELVERASRMSEQAENSEPLLAKQLYDSVRQLTQKDTKTVKDLHEQLVEQGLVTRDLNDRLTQLAQDESKGKSLALASELLQHGQVPSAGEALRQAAGATREFQRGVEKAAEGVLGDDVASLKLAQSELGAVTGQLQQELRAQEAREAAGARPVAGGPAGPRPGDRADPRTEADSPGGPNPGAPSGNVAQNGPPAPGRPGQPGAPGAPEAAAAPGEPGPTGATGKSGPATGAAGVPGDPGRLARGEPGPRGRMGIEDLDHAGRAGVDAPDDALAGLDGPLLGNDFGGWSDRLRDVEQLVDQPAWRDAVANARERARRLRQEYTRDRRKPDWAVVRAQVMAPLLEVRGRIGEELARRDNPESLVPIDRDPVPGRYAESVRRYYEELGKD